MEVLHINSYYFKGKFYKNLYDIQQEHMNIYVYMPIQNDDCVEYDYGNYTLTSHVFNKSDRALFHVKHNKIFKDILIKYDFNKINIIHAHSLFSNGYIAYKLNKKYGIPYVVAVRNTDVNVFFSKMLHLRKLGINILKNSDSVIFLSESYKNKVIQKYIPQHLKKNIIEKAMVIPNGIDNFWIEHRQNKVLKNRKKITIITVGEISDNKNQITVCKICDALEKEGYNIEYKIAGKILNQNTYNSIIKKKYVKYEGFLSKEELIEKYRESNIFVLLSKRETFGLVYAEAMSQGLPIIYTRGEGFDKQFSEGVVGYSVDADNVKDAMKYIKLILEDYDRISYQASYSCLQFDWKKIEEEYSDLYAKVLYKK